MHVHEIRQKSQKFLHKYKNNGDICNMWKRVFQRYDHDTNPGKETHWLQTV